MAYSTSWLRRAYYGTPGQSTVSAGTDALRSAAYALAKNSDQNNLTAFVARKTALTRERARLDDMVGQYDQSDTELWDDWHKRSNAINDALAKLNSQISTAEGNARLGQYDKLRSNSDFAEYAAKGEALENPSYEKAQSGIYLFGNRIGDDGVRNRATYARDNSERLAQADTAMMSASLQRVSMRWRTARYTFGRRTAACWHWGMWSFPAPTSRRCTRTRRSTTPTRRRSM